MAAEKNIVWRQEVDEDNYSSAQSYLLLVLEDEAVTSLIAKLRKAKLTQFRAKDIFRASQLPLLGISNSRIEKNLKKIEKGASFSPLLLVRDVANGRVVIADGYHRVCAVYSVDDEAWIQCKIV